jgi:hypothetical protein
MLSGGGEGGGKLSLAWSLLMMKQTQDTGWGASQPICNAESKQKRRGVRVGRHSPSKRCEVVWRAGGQPIISQRRPHGVLTNDFGGKLKLQ